MHISKVAIACLISMLTVSVMPVVSAPVFAAKGGVRISAPKALPAAPKAAPANGANTSNAGTAGKTANQTQGSQQARTNTQQQTAAQTGTQARNTSSPWGGAMRNIGLLAGGMFLGSMLSSLFGWGNMGFMADVLGVLFNIILLLVIVSLAARLWRKFRGAKRTTDDDAYRRGYEAAKREAQFRQHGPTIDVTPLDDDTPHKRV